MTDIVDIGTLPNDGTGDPLRVAFDKINQNFANVAQLGPSGPEGSFQFNNSGFPLGTANFAYNSSTNVINIGADLIPTANSNIEIGSANAKIAKLYLDQSSLVLGNVTVSESGNTVSFPLTVLPGTNASIAANNIEADGNVTVNGTLNLSGQKINTFDITTTSDTANQIIFQTPAVEFNNGRFQVTTREDGSLNSQTVTLVLNKRNNNTSVSFSAFGTIFNGIPVTRYNADVAFGNVRVLVSPMLNTTMTHTVAYQIET